MLLLVRNGIQPLTWDVAPTQRILMPMTFAPTAPHRAAIEALLIEELADGVPASLNYLADYIWDEMVQRVEDVIRTDTEAAAERDVREAEQERIARAMEARGWHLAAAVAREDQP